MPILQKFQFRYFSADFSAAAALIAQCGAGGPPPPPFGPVFPPPPHAPTAGLPNGFGPPPGAPPNGQLPVGPLPFPFLHLEALQQFVVQPGNQTRKNASREVSAPLKHWLNEHRKNPYPTKAEKTMLAIITKMTMTQASPRRVRPG